MLGLRTVVYKVSDLAKAKDWYSQAFGKSPYFDQPFYVGFNIGGYELGLHPVEDEVVYGNASVAYWGVEKIGRTYQRLLDLGAQPYEAPTNVGGDIEVASVIDPWGNVIGIIYNPEFEVE